MYAVITNHVLLATITHPHMVLELTCGREERKGCGERERESERERGQNTINRQKKSSEMFKYDASPFEHATFPQYKTYFSKLVTDFELDIQTNMSFHLVFFFFGFSHSGVLITKATTLGIKCENWLGFMPF